MHVVLEAAGHPMVRQNAVRLHETMFRSVVVFYALIVTLVSELLRGGAPLAFDSHL